MTSRRTEVRQAFAALITGLPTAGARVFRSRTRPLQAAELPAVLVFSGEAEMDDEVIGLQQPSLVRYRLRADILVKEGADNEDIADQILQEISDAVFASVSANTLSGKVQGLQLISVGEPDLDDSLEKPALRLPVLFETVYSE